MREDLDFAEYQRLLEQRWQQIQNGEIERRKESAPVELDQAKVGRLSRMDALQQQSMAQASARRSSVELQRIKTALSRLTSGQYGYCVHCEEDISIGRLRVDPAALTCIDCARAAER